MKKTILIFLSILCLFSCSQKFDGKNGLLEEYYSSGNGTALKKSIEYVDGEKNGAYKEFYISSTLKTEAYYKKGTLHGTRKHYFENGQLKAEESYKEGLRDSIYKYYYKNGNVETERMYSKGKLNGIYSKYYKDGKPEILHYYRDGELNGEIKEFYPNGQVKYIAFFDNGAPGIGLKEYYEDGSPVNNNFKIQVKEVNQLAIKSECYYYINFSPPNNNYEVYEGLLKDGKYFDKDKYYDQLEYQKGNGYKKRYIVYSGDYKMEDLNVIAVTKTSMGNKMIQTKKIRVSLNNYF